MNYTLNFFLQAGVNIPIWVAVITPVGLILVGAISALITYWLNKPKTTVEIETIKGKNREQDSRMFEFKNTIFQDTQDYIENVEKKLNTTRRELNNALASNEILEMEKSKLLGKVELALKERDDVLLEVKEIEKRFEKQLKDAIAKEQAECDRKIQLLHEEGKTFDRRISSLEQSNISDHNVANVSEQIADEKLAEHREVDHK
jgi:hypothetical protein